ncbi:unnamed protein product [Penicillium salamii]|uniref:Hydroxyneurosporene synthase n=1 Tax=Penicillium salamii TaxID=1612424 RepID=A0A9W4JXL7_9EURO|nr:unnamed protein product [Penicillium salamii]CAG7951940.1 unnamed protein product [Penicillium salamii]CAG8005002.1 unnamed protein product [Penicillium salamii]CAG8048391.1 unnamed protein product [Penicillium salamii]CAG8131476.1 unnamed protein product [Penicillium salamii]
MFTMLLLPLLLVCALMASQASAFPKRHMVNLPPYLQNIKRSDTGNYQIPSDVHNGSSKAVFDIETTTSTLTTSTLLSLDAPKLDSINGSVFDWWYFDVVSEANPDDSVTVTFFSSTVEAFPFLAANQSSILTAWIWASFANGTVVADYVPATVATVTGVDGTHTEGSGHWFPTGFGWGASTAPQTRYVVSIASEKIQVHGRLTLTATVPYHLPCGVQKDKSILEIAPHIGWVNAVPDAVGVVDMNIRGSSLKFQGPGYHDKNWSDRPFMESVESWYWGHGRLGPYSIVWFSFLSLNDTTNSTYVSSYVAKDGNVLVSACDEKLLTVRPIGAPGTTGGRYPPKVGDVPEGFHLDYDLGEEIGHLKVNVSTRALVAGDGEYYGRWTGELVGEVVKPGNDTRGACSSDSGNGSDAEEISLVGVAVFEQFVVVE